MTQSRLPLDSTDQGVVSVIRCVAMRIRGEFVMVGLGLIGCGNSIYVLRITQASDELARAEQLDAARKAPYEYHFALEHLRKARTEAAEADFGDAIRLAEVAHIYARRAVEVGQKVEPVKQVAAPESP